MITGMNVDDALDQLDLHPFDEAKELKETVLEAIDLAINNHGFEFRSARACPVKHSDACFDAYIDFNHSLLFLKYSLLPSDQ